MPIYERGAVRIRYEVAGSGPPVLIIPGGGLNSTLAGLDTTHPFNPMTVFSNQFRCVGADLRNANGGESTGPLELDRPWDSYTDDHLGLMDHLGIDKFLVLGFCIGGPFIWNLIKRAPDRIVAAVLTQPSGARPDMPDLFYNNNMTGWGPKLCERDPSKTMETVSNSSARCMAATTSSSPSTANSCAPARRRSSSCRTTCRRIPTRWRWKPRCWPRTRR